MINKKLIFITAAFLQLIPLFGIRQVIAQEKKSSATDAAQIDNYKEQTKRLIGFLDFSLNTLGDPETSTKDKEVIINSSYLKAFRDDKVQIEDDLDPNRKMVTYKDVQAYLKDVDFFFKHVTFKYDVKEIQPLVNDKGKTYFKVTANRNIDGLTVEGDTIINNQIRYIEIDLDEDEQVLKIASIYTTKPNETQEMIAWWNNMPTAWKVALAGGYKLNDSTAFASVSFLSDTTLGILHPIAMRINMDTMVVVGLDTLSLSHPDTTFTMGIDTVPVAGTVAFQILSEIRNFKDLNISGNINIRNLAPVEELTNLTSLDFSNTMISDLFPVRNLTKLVDLNCSGSSVSDLSPIMYNTNIKNIYIDNTPIKSLNAVSNFEALEMLHFSHTLIDSLQALKYLSNIRELRFEYTPVADLTPLGNLTKLEMLNLSGTQVSNLQPIQFLTSLKRIEFDSTSISDLTPLSRLSNLEIINCDNTGVADLSPLAGLANLQKVYCDKTHITRSIATMFMNAHHSVLVIYESGELNTWWDGLNDNWKGIFRTYTELSEPPTTEQLHKLSLITKVDISGKHEIESLDPLSKIANLVELNCTGTSVSDLGPLHEMIDMQMLDCHDTRVKSLEALSGLTHLQELYVNNTPLQSIKGLSGLSSLQILNIEDTEVDSLDPVIKITSLKRLYCDRSRVGQADISNFLESNPDCLVIYQTSLLKGWWKGLPYGWQTIFRKYVKLDADPTREQLQEIANIKALNFDGDKTITTLEPVNMLPRLGVLSFADTQIGDLSPLSKMVDLRELNISNNPVTNLKPIFGLPYLTHLNISNIPIKSLDKINQLKSLEYLNCSGTDVKKLDPLETLYHLKRLECYNTRVKSLDAIADLPALRQVKCYNTSLSSKKVQEFKDSHPQVEVVFY